jgi:hypothetical protein
VTVIGCDKFPGAVGVFERPQAASAAAIAVIPLRARNTRRSMSSERRAMQGQSAPHCFSISLLLRM